MVTMRMILINNDTCTDNDDNDFDEICELKNINRQIGQYKERNFKKILRN